MQRFKLREKEKEKEKRKNSVFLLGKEIFLKKTYEGRNAEL